MSWPTLLSSAVIAALVAGIFTLVNNRVAIYATYKLEQKKELKKLIGSYHGRMLEAATDWDRRMHQLYNDPDHAHYMAPGEERRHDHDQYLYLSVVFRFLSLLGIARKFEAEAFFIDSRIARRKDLEFLRFAKSFLWVMTISDLTPDDGLPGRDHFRSDEFRPLLDACYRREDSVLPANEPKDGELAFDWQRFRVLLDRSRMEGEGKVGNHDSEVNLTTALDADTRAEMEQMLEFFDGIKPNEYEGDLKRRRWERIICLHLLVVCFIGTFGYSWQREKKTIDEKRSEAIAALKKEAAFMARHPDNKICTVLEAFHENLYLTDMKEQKRIAELKSDLAHAMIVLRRTDNR